MEAIRYYVQGAFQGVKMTPDVLEQQEELIADLSAKVDDLVAQGKSQDEALGVAIASLGDLSPLVSEFEAADDTTASAPTAALYATRLDLHVVAVSAAIGAAVMCASTVLGAWTGLIHPSAGSTLLAVLVVGAWWVRGAYRRYQESPEAVEVRELVGASRFHKALLVWVGVLIGATVLNAITGSEFWCWPIWVAGGTWALAALIEQRMVGRAEFTAPALAD